MAIESFGLVRVKEPEKSGRCLSKYGSNAKPLSLCQSLYTGRVSSNPRVTIQIKVSLVTATNQ